MYQEILKYTHGHRVKLIAVSKTKTPAEIMKLYDQGQRVFGENRVQELVTKYELLPNDIEWHLIGHLQTNKVKYAVPIVVMIHSVDSFDLLKTIDKEAQKIKKTMSVLLQIHIATEDTKFGLSMPEAIELLEQSKVNSLNGVSIRGVMGIGSFTDDMEQVKAEFRTLKMAFDTLKTKYFHDDADFCELSMGMSSDYKEAIAEGSTMVRVGSAIFGSR